MGYGPSVLRLAKTIRARAGLLFSEMMQWLFASKSVLDTANRVLNLASDLISLAFTFELTVTRDLAGNLFHFALRLLYRAFNAVFIHDILLNPHKATPSPRKGSVQDGETTEKEASESIVLESSGNQCPPQVPIGNPTLSEQLAVGGFVRLLGLPVSDVPMAFRSEPA
jgi:hypothetical protein